MRQPNTLWAGAESLNLNRRLQSRVIEVVSLVQWLGPHRLAKPNQTIGLPTPRDESHIPEWLLSKNRTRSIVGVQVKRTGYS
jgi:hypothetical protein